MDKSQRVDQTFSRADFRFDHRNDRYLCPAGKELLPSRRQFQTIRPQVKDDETARYRSLKADCDACELKFRCCPRTPTRAVTRSIHEGARDLARAIAETDAFVASRRARREVEMLFAHTKKIMGLSRLRLRGPNGAKDEFTLAATAQNLRKMAKLLPTPA
ncbi:MAG: transposase [Planctomycetota bacterium]